MAAGGEDLLAQIRDLLDQYLALGPDTPVATQAQGLATAIDSVETGGQGEGGGLGDMMGGMDMMTDASPAPPTDDGPVDNTALLGGEEGYSGTDMGDARAAAKDFLRKRKSGQGA